ncbi:hypothetical protein H2248_003223 [Termitomyces sp. 'cryptogamus']|nr:hypothetical protein H2248_003223 [Termitomyces sp. 'cryptogamus']
MSLSVDNQRGFEADSITSNSLRSFPASSTSQSTNTLAGLGVTTPTTVVIFPNTATVTSNIDSRPVQRSGFLLVEQKKITKIQSLFVGPCPACIKFSAPASLDTTASPSPTASSNTSGPNFTSTNTVNPNTNVPTNSPTVMSTNTTSATTSSITLFSISPTTTVTSTSSTKRDGPITGVVINTPAEDKLHHSPLPIHSFDNTHAISHLPSDQ